MSSSPELRLARLDHSGRSFILPLMLFASISIAYLSLTAIIIASSPCAALILTLPCGLLIGDLFVIGHDACHQSFTASRRLNSIIGRLAFLPSMHSYALWDHGHNRVHHKYNNIKGKDYVWEPMSPAEFKNAGLLRRTRYKFFRSVLGMPFYYMFEIWLPKMIVPRSSIVGAVNTRHRLDSLYVVVFFISQIAAVCLFARLVGAGTFHALFFGVAIPLVVYNVLMSAVIYVHHTHPEVPWYTSVEEWRQKNGAIMGTVHVRFPILLRIAMLEITEHNAHHFAPGVPLYNLHSMQDEVTSHSAGIVSWDFNLYALLSVISKCKLYDFERGHWTGYNGELLEVRSPRQISPEPAL